MLEMPKDFAKHANDSIAQIRARYGVGYGVQRRWREELGLPPRTQKKQVQQIDIQTGEVLGVFDCADDAGVALYTSPCGIGVAARRYPDRTAGGYRWRYV